MTRRGVPIKDLRLKRGVDPGISYSSSFGEMEAASAAGLDFFRWMLGDPKPYPNFFKAQVLAWYELHQLVAAHTQEAVADAEEREAKKAARRRGR